MSRMIKSVFQRQNYVGLGLTREKGDDEALATATSSSLTMLEYINRLIDNEKFEDQDDQENN